MSDSKTSSGGVGFAGLLTIAFVVLKLCKVIDWSWWWVVSPILISIGLALLVLGGIGMYYLWTSYKEKKEFQKRIKRNKSITDEVIDKYKHVINNISEDADTRSMWQQRLYEMEKKQSKNN